MRYFAFLLPVILFACGQNTPEQQKAAPQDSALYTALVLPLTDSINRFPGDAGLHFRRALLLFNTDPALAQRDFEKAAALQPSVTDYWAGAGESALLSNDIKKAVQYFERALQTAPTYGYLQYRLAAALIENRDYTKADSLASVLARSEGTHDKAYYLKARIAEDRQDTALAIRHLSTAIDAAGLQSDYDAVMELGDLLLARGAPAALRYYQLAYRLDSGNAEPLYSIGRFHEQQGKKTEAIAAYKNCIAADPGYEEAYLALGHIYRRQQEWKSAFGYYNLAAKTAPTDAEAYYYRGLCHEKLGRRDAAFADFTKALSFKRDYKEAEEALKRLNN